MKKSFLLLMAMVSLFYYSEKANAGLLLEPFAGTHLNSTYDNDTGDDKGDISGTVIGARLGFQNLGFMLGLDGRRSSYSMDSENGGSATDFTFTTLGLFAGYDFPIMLRVWGNYVFSHNGVNDDDSDHKLNEGSGLTLGLGYKVIPFVSINFEMSNYKTTKVDTSGVSDYDYDVAYSTYLLSVSFPLSL